MLNVSGPVNLEIHTRSGGIRVNTGPANTVRVVGRVRARGWFEDDDRQATDIAGRPPVYQEGNTIRVGDSADNLIPQRVSIGYEVTVPDTARINAVTGSGGIRLSGVRGAVVARVGSGGIRIDGTPRAAWILRTGSGGIRVNVDNDAPFTLEAQVRSGGIHSGQPVAATVSTRNRLQGTVRGGGALV